MSVERRFQDDYCLSYYIYYYCLHDMRAYGVATYYFCDGWSMLLMPALYAIFQTMIHAADDASASAIWHDEPWQNGLLFIFDAAIITLFTALMAMLIFMRVAAFHYEII